VDIMGQSEEEKLKTIVSYLHEQIPESDVDIKPLQKASLFYVLTVKTPNQQYRSEICRLLIEDQDHSVSEVQRLLVRDDLAQKVLASNSEGYCWNPV
jgi:hypothetical protein